MTGRERFESIISASPYEKSVARWPNLPVKFAWPGGYKDLNVDLAWCMWQASRKQTLEEAIEEAEGSAKAYMGHARGGDNSGASDHKADALVDFAEELRALSNPEGEQG